MIVCDIVLVFLLVIWHIHWVWYPFVVIVCFAGWWCGYVHRLLLSLHVTVFVVARHLFLRRSSLWGVDGGERYLDCLRAARLHCLLRFSVLDAIGWDRISFLSQDYLPQQFDCGDFVHWWFLWLLLDRSIQLFCCLQNSICWHQLWDGDGMTLEFNFVWDSLPSLWWKYSSEWTIVLEAWYQVPCFFGIEAPCFTAVGLIADRHFRPRGCNGCCFKVIFDLHCCPRWYQWVLSALYHNIKAELNLWA